MKKSIGIVLVSFLICNTNGNSARAANVLQVKGNSAILELSDLEFKTLQPEAGKNIRIIANGKAAVANIKKILNAKILINSNVNLTGTKSVQVLASNSNVSINEAGPRGSRSGNSNEKNKNTSQKNWILGGNLQYVTGSSSILIAPLASRTLNYSGFNVSGVGFYYFDSIGVGGRADYTFGNGTTATSSDKITQVDLSFLGEYKFKTFSVGAMLVLFSNIRDTDNLNNDNSLNSSGLGYGLFATYDAYPQIKLLLNYKTVNYKLDPASYGTSDIRLGAGYYF